MRTAITALSILLGACSGQDVSREKPEVSINGYAACMRTESSKYGSPQAVTREQARSAALVCKPLLRAAAEETLKELVANRRRNEPSDAWQAATQNIPFLEQTIENEEMRKISTAVLPLPQV